MSERYSRVLRATGESDAGQVAKAGQWAADEIERLTAELDLERDAYLLWKVEAEHRKEIHDKFLPEFWNTNAENERLTSQVESLQNKCANRGLSPEDSDALQARVEALEKINYNLTRDNTEQANKIVGLKHEIQLLTVNLQNMIDIEYGPFEATEQGESDE